MKITLEKPNDPTGKISTRAVQEKKQDILPSTVQKPWKRWWKFTDNNIPSRITPDLSNKPSTTSTSLPTEDYGYSNPEEEIHMSNGGESGDFFINAIFVNKKSKFKCEKPEIFRRQVYTHCVRRSFKSYSTTTDRFSYRENNFCGGATLEKVSLDF